MCVCVWGGGSSNQIKTKIGLIVRVCLLKKKLPNFVSTCMKIGICKEKGRKRNTGYGQLQYILTVSAFSFSSEFY